MRAFHRFIAALVAALVLAGSQITFASPLVNVDWLKANLSRKDVLLIDASFPQQHAQGHIPGAVNVDVFRFGAAMPEPLAMEAEYRRWGIDAGKTVVLYDQGGGYLAPSVFFDLYHHGFPVEKLKILDGGLAKWKASGGEIIKETTPQPAPGSFRVSMRAATRTEHTEFVTATGDVKANAIVEAMGLPYRYGATQFFDRGGHVPRSITLPNEDLFNADKTFKSPAEIRKMAGFLGIRPEQTVHTMCGGGVAAAGPYFALKFIAEYPKVQLYKGSQREWLMDERRLPVWTHDNPHLMRDAKSVNAWNQPMLRSFEVSGISIIDVRSAEQHAAGHIPYSLSVPVASLMEAGNDSARLTKLLEAAGVNAADEAVVVSDGGVTPAAAYAHAVLTRAGQAKVSILMESIDDWGLAGFPITKEITKVGARTGPKDIVVPARPYVPAPPSSPARAADYERVYIASGAAMPKMVPPGKVIHLPYRELLDTQGAPKAAKDIWARIDKAGISRYAELVFVADEPGEAAANYYLFKLMGYPHLNVRLYT
jgi:3-mercaptopyruvate sulfurtransferase SseA